MKGRRNVSLTEGQSLRWPSAGCIWREAGGCQPVARSDGLPLESAYVPQRRCQLGPWTLYCKYTETRLCGGHLSTGRLTSDAQRHQKDKTNLRLPTHFTKIHTQIFRFFSSSKFLLRVTEKVNVCTSVGSFLKQNPVL